MSKPLDNKLIALTRDASGNQAWQPHLVALGARVYSLPTIETAPLPLSPDVANVARNLNRFDWLVLTSAASLRYLLEQASGSGGPPLGSVKLAVIGPATAAAARQAELRVAFQPSHADSKTLARELDILPSGRVVWPHSTRAPQDLARILRSRGAEITEIPLYETRALETPDPEMNRLLQEKAVGCLVFASPSAAEGFGRRVSGESFRLAQTVPALAAGRGIAERLMQAGFTCVHTSDQPSISGIAGSLVRLLQ